MTEDQAQNRLDNRPQHITVLRHLALTPLNADATKRQAAAKSQETIEAMPDSRAFSQPDELRSPWQPARKRIIEHEPGKQLCRCKCERTLFGDGDRFAHGASVPLGDKLAPRRPCGHSCRAGSKEP